MNNLQKTYLVSGVIIIIVVLMIGLLVKPLFVETRQTSTLVLEENQKLLAAREADIDYLKKVENDYKKIKADIDTFKIYLNDDQIVGFIKELEAVANGLSSTLEIKSANFPVFNLSLTGTFSSSLKFLGWLENSPYLVSVESMQIKKISEKDFSSEEAKTLSADDVNTTLQIKLPLKKHESE